MEEEQQFLWFSCLSNTWPTHLVYSQTEQYSTKVSRLLFLQSDYLHLVVRPRWRQRRTHNCDATFPQCTGMRELHEAGSVTRLWESCLHLYSLFSSLSLLLVGVVFEWETRYNVHWLKFLEQQFAGVRNLQRRDVVWWLTVMTPWKKKQIFNCITLLLS